MIVSPQHGFVFIKTRKTAGTSIEVFLSQHAGEDAIVTPIDPPVTGHQARNVNGFYNHVPAHIVRDAMGIDLWRRFTSFCVARNPWDKVLSEFYFVNAREHQGRLTLSEWLGSGPDFMVDRPIYTDPVDGSLIVDHVLHYETLTEDLARLLPTFGIRFDGDLGVRAKSEYRTDRRPYREVFTDAEAAIVADAFAWEIEQFAYAY